MGKSGPHVLRKYSYCQLPLGQRDPGTSPTWVGDGGVMSPSSHGELQTENGSEPRVPGH